MSLEYPASGEKQDRPEPELVQNSGHVDTALDEFYEMDGRESRYTREVLDWYRDEDAGDLMKSELDEPVENMISLSAHEGKNGKRNQNIVMNLKLVKNIVMNEDFVKGSVMTAQN